MLASSELVLAHYIKKWAEKYGLDLKYANEALKMITELTTETDYDEDSIEAVVLSSYPLNPPESLLDKFDKAKNNKNAGKLVKFSKY